MYVTCWNCKNDQEVSEDSIRNAERQKIAASLEHYALVCDTTGYILRGEVFRDAAKMVRAGIK